MSDSSFWINIIGNFGAIGFIFWLVWRTTNYTIPKLAKSFEGAIRENREDFKDMLQQQRDDFREALTEQREFFIQYYKANPPTQSPHTCQRIQ